MNNELVTTKQAANIIYYTSYFQLIVITCGSYYGLNDCCIAMALFFTTSTNYWKNPLLNSLLRKVDILCAISVISYHWWRVGGYTCETKYRTSIFMGCLLYPISWYVSICKKNELMSALLHSGLHMILNFSAIGIYSCIHQENM